MKRGGAAMKAKANGRWTGGERGASLVLVGIGLTALLSVMSLAVDLGMLYVARSQAQRAADAAALAGASTFLQSGCTSSVGGCVNGGSQEGPAREQAKAAAAQNAILGQPASVANSDISFYYPTPEEPQIVVNVTRAGIPTIFAKMFLVSTATVRATATAEAYNPDNGTANVDNSCVAPFLVPNCDPLHTGAPSSTCSWAGTAGTFVTPGSTPDTSTVTNRGFYPQGVVGEQWQLHFGDTGPSNGAAPSHWYLVAFDSSQSASQLSNNISQCAPKKISCGDTLQTFMGKAVGPVDQGIEDRIHALGLGMDQGQDTISFTGDTSNPFSVTGGMNNPVSSQRGQVLQGTSDSMVTVPVYDGHELSPGWNTVTVVGFIQMFIQSVDHQGTYNGASAMIVAATGCNDPGGSGGSVSSNGSTLIPIRLIQQHN
jgi:hypothetical protein